MQKNLHFLSHHKCASVWLNYYLQICSETNQLTLFSTYFSDVSPDKNADFVHVMNARYKCSSSYASNGCHVIRNPFSIITSAYYSHKSSHPLDGWNKLKLQRHLLNKYDEATGFLLTVAFLEREDFHDHAAGPLNALRTWNYADTRYKTVRMEDFVLHPSRVFREMMDHVAGADWSLNLPDDNIFKFENFSGGRTVGNVDETSHYRSGQQDDWRQHLPGPVLDYVRIHYRDILEAYYPESLS